MKLVIIQDIYEISNVAKWINELKFLLNKIFIFDLKKTLNCNLNFLKFELNKI